MVDYLFLTQTPNCFLSLLILILGSFLSNFFLPMLRVRSLQKHSATELHPYPPIFLLPTLTCWIPVAQLDILGFSITLQR